MSLLKRYRILINGDSLKTGFLIKYTCAICLLLLTETILLFSFFPLRALVTSKRLAELYAKIWCVSKLLRLKVREDFSRNPLSKSSAYEWIKSRGEKKRIKAGLTCFSKQTRLFATNSHSKSLRWRRSRINSPGRNIYDVQDQNSTLPLLLHLDWKRDRAP